LLAFSLPNSEWNALRKAPVIVDLFFSLEVVGFVNGVKFVESIGFITFVAGMIDAGIVLEIKVLTTGDITLSESAR
jgi:hypothetical protein